MNVSQDKTYSRRYDAMCSCVLFTTLAESWTFEPRICLFFEEGKYYSDMSSFGLFNLSIPSWIKVEDNSIRTSW